MKKKEILAKYPDCLEMELKTGVVLSRKQIEELVNKVTELTEKSPVYFEHSGKEITIYASKKFKDAISLFKAGTQVTDPNTEEVGTIISDDPFFVCGELCMRVKFANGSDVYSCDYFIPEEL